MKQFNLEEYLQNPDRKVVTRNGESVRIICTDLYGEKPIIAKITEVCEHSYPFYEDGRFLSYGEPSGCDLFFAPEKKERWINLFENPNPYQSYRMPIIANELLYKTKDEAEEVGNSSDGYIRTVKIEWEE